MSATERDELLHQVGRLEAFAAYTEAHVTDPDFVAEFLRRVAKDLEQIATEH